MNISTLAISISNTLAPFFPYLIKGIRLTEQEWFESLGEKAGKEAMAQAKSTWEKIKGRSFGNKTLEGAAMLLSDDPANTTIQKMFADALTDILKKHPDLAEELTEYQKSAPSITIDQRSGGVYFAGPGTISIRGDVVGRDQTKEQ